MTVDKLVDSTQLDSDLTSVANAIRTKGGTSASLAFPNDFVTAIGDIQTGITPTGTKQISVTSNGTTTEDVTNYANAEITTNVPTTLKLGAIRPDAELVQTWSYDKLIVEDEEVTIPAYTTTQTTLKSWANLSPTYTADRDNYYYFAQGRGLTIPIYNTTAIDTGRLEYAVNCFEQEYVMFPANSVQALVNTTKNSALSLGFARNNSYQRDVYWSNSSTLAVGIEAYGAYQAFTLDVSMGGNTITARQPFFYIRGHNTYFNQTYWNALTDIRFQFVVELYRVPKASLNLGGWNTYQQMRHAIDCAETASHNLT